MAQVWLHRTTLRQLHSVSPADLPSPRTEWIEEPDLSAVTGFAPKYWIIAGDVVTLMGAAARAAVDAAEDVVTLNSIADQLEEQRTVMRGFAEVVLDEINSLRALHGRPARTLRQLRNAVRGKL